MSDFAVGTRTLSPAKPHGHGSRSVELPGMNGPHPTAAARQDNPVTRRWPAGGFTRAPCWVYGDPAVYAREQEAISWHYNLKGDLTFVAFRNGLKGEGGLPKDFDLQEHGLQKLRVASMAGVVFATFHRGHAAAGGLAGGRGRGHPPRVQRAAEGAGLRHAAHPCQLEGVPREPARLVPRQHPAHLLRHLRLVPAIAGVRHGAGPAWAQCSMAPAGTPPEVAQALLPALQKAARNAQIAARLLPLGLMQAWVPAVRRSPRNTRSWWNGPGGWGRSPRRPGAHG